MSPVSLLKCLALRRSNKAVRVSTVFLLALAALCSMARFAPAQQDVGYILGTVTDQSGAAIAGAKVTITWQTTSLSQSVVTNNVGFYTSQPLQVGRYSVLVEMRGFTSAMVPNVIVDAAAHVQTNVVLHVGSTSANITVEATPPVIDTTDAEVVDTVDSRAAQQLPVNGRSVLALAMFTPGVVSDVGAVSEGFTNRGTAVSNIRIAGGVTGQNSNILDGVSNLQDYLGEVAINLKSDAVQEYRIMSGVIPAQFGYTTGGVIDEVSRSGSNTVHGSVYEFFRNDALDAEQAFPRPKFGKQETRFNNYGGTLGGPIRRNKMFLFGNYEQYNYVSNSPSYFTVPTAQEYGGNFSDLGQVVGGVCQPINIYDDSNIVGGQRQQFVYNGVPNEINPSRLDPVAVAYQKLFYPQPNNTSGSYNSCTHANNYLFAAPIVGSERQGLVRSDYKLGDNDNVVARYAYYLNVTNNGSGFGGVYSDRNDHLQNQDGVLSEIHVFKPTLLNDARLGFVRGDFPFVAGSYNLNIASTIGLPNDTGYETPVMSNGITSPNTTIGFRSSTTIEGIDDVTWTLKQQTLHLGVSARFAEGYNYQASGVSGTYNFSSGTTAQGNDTTIVTGTGSQYASYLLGQATGGSQAVYGGSAYRRMMYAAYVQDDWHATPHLTINAGLRWDYMTQAVEKHNGLDNFDITQKNSVNGYAGAVEYAGVNGFGRNFVPENYGDVGPRLGFAYALGNDNKTIVRGGVAIYYASTAQVSYDYSSGSNNGFATISTSWSATTAHGIDFQLQNGLPGTWSQLLGAAGGQNAFLGQTGYYIEPKAKDPTDQEFTLTVSRELPWGLVADASYLGNHGNHFVQVDYNLDTLDPQYFSLGTAALSAQEPNPYAGIVPGSLGAATLTEASLLRPYPYMSSVTLYWPRNQSSFGNMAMLALQRRIEHGLQVNGAYTFGKITDDGVYADTPTTGGTQTGSAPQNWRNPRGEHSVDAFDVTHRATVSVLYNLPFGSGQRFLSSSHIDRLISGWQYNVIMTLESGRPIGVTGATNQGVASRPNINPNVSIKVPHPSRSVLYTTGSLEWFNPEGFVDPPDYSFGNVPRYFGNVRGPGTENFDMSLFKTTPITEGTTLEFRIEAYNALNHDNLSMPGTAFVAGPPAVSSNPYAEGGLNTSSTFGMITASGPIRNVQLAAKFFF